MTQAHTTEMSPAMQHLHTHMSASLGAIIEDWGEGGSLTYHPIPYNAIVQFDGVVSRESINIVVRFAVR